MKILVADDDFVARSMICNILKKMGHEAIAAEDGGSAWEMIQASQIRMVITDWMMPGMDGPTLCRTIREKSLWGYVFIFLLTAKDDTESIIKGLKSGADDYLSKPFNRAEFEARLNTGMRLLELEASLQKANEEIRLLSLTCPLTGCYNKRYFEEQFPKEMKRSIRYRHPLAIVMCDVDHFKHVNDTYGHPVGDEVLQIFVKGLDRSLRKDVDWIVRYGGEEFLIVMPETTLANAQICAERIRQTIAETTFAVGEEELHVTASFGVAGLDASNAAPDVDPQSLIQRADELLYQAKKSGRNRVVSDPVDKDGV